MTAEIEIRALVSDYQAAEESLLQAGFVPAGQVNQIDIMYDKPAGELFVSGQKIRIRIEGDRAELTYKGAFQGDMSASRRAELNIQLNADDVANAGTLLEALGYPMLFQIQKLRKTFRKEGVVATLDHWPIIGAMVELEGDENEIKAIAGAAFPDAAFANHRLKSLFEATCAERGRSLSDLQADYERETGFSLGNISFLLR